MSKEKEEVLREAVAAYAAGEDAAEVFERLGRRHGIPPLEVGRIVVHAMKKAEPASPAKSTTPDRKREVL